MTQLAEQEGVRRFYTARVVRLAFLSPAVTHAILNGSVRSHVDAAALTATDRIPACWQARARAMLPVSAVRP